MVRTGNKAIPRPVHAISPARERGYRGRCCEWRVQGGCLLAMYGGLAFCLCLINLPVVLLLNIASFAGYKCRSGAQSDRLMSLPMALRGWNGSGSGGVIQTVGSGKGNTDDGLHIEDYGPVSKCQFCCPRAGGVP